jgi:hypothetical protein
VVNVDQAAQAARVVAKADVADLDLVGQADKVALVALSPNLSQRSRRNRTLAIPAERGTQA